MELYKVTDIELYTTEMGDGFQNLCYLTKKFMF